jgi:hypothetical protein
VLSEWAQDPTWLARAQEVEGRIMAIPGSAYAQAKDWDGRFQAVVDAVHAVYGPSPAAQRIRPSAAAQGRAAPAALPQDAELDVPPSISALGAGQAMTDRDDQMAALERMTPSEMMRHIGTLADKGLLAKALAGLSV